jgi:hypothetical protein
MGCLSLRRAAFTMAPGSLPIAAGSTGGAIADNAIPGSG